MPLSAKERQQRWRDKKKSTHNGLAEYKCAEHERYLRRKQTGSRKLVKDMSEQEHRIQKRRWWSWKDDSIRRRRENQQELLDLELLDLDSSVLSNASESIQVDEVNSTTQLTVKVRGRKKVRKDRAKAYQTIQKLEEELKKKNCYRDIANGCIEVAKMLVKILPGHRPNSS